MAPRSRDWLKFSGLLGLTLIVAAVFIGALGSPTRAAQPGAFVMPEPPATQVSATAAVQEGRAVPTAAAPLTELGEAFSAVANIIRPAVVFIRAESFSTENPHPDMQVPRGLEEFFYPRGQPREPQRRRGTGSGFIISSDGYIMTNNHVVEGATKVTVRLLDKRQFEAKVVGRDPQTDVAVIKIDAQDLPTATLGNSDNVRIGEWVLAVGNPLGEAFSFTVTAGIVSAKGRLLEGLPNRSSYSIMDFIQTDAAINPGNSGGPLVNVQGQVVGVNSAIASENGFYQGYGFAIPANLARVVGNQLIAEGRVRRSVLGVAIDDAEEEDAAYAGFNEVRGVRVNDYSMPNSPAEKAGIQIGDLIVELDGEPVHYVAQLQQLVGFKEPGSTVKVTVVRKGGERRTLSVQLVEAPRDEAAQVASREREEPREDTAGTSTALGISVRQPPTEIASRLGDDHTGVVVMDVEASSPALDRLTPARNGIRDIITHVDGTRVRTVAQFERAMAAVRSGQIVSLRVYDAAAEASKVVRLRVP
jgi:serine protease Do